MIFIYLYIPLWHKYILVCTSTYWYVPVWHISYHFIPCYCLWRYVSFVRFPSEVQAGTYRNWVPNPVINVFIGFPRGCQLSKRNSINRHMLLFITVWTSTYSSIARFIAVYRFSLRKLTPWRKPDENVYDRIWDSIPVCTILYHWWKPHKTYIQPWTVAWYEMVWNMSYWYISVRTGIY